MAKEREVKRADRDLRQHVSKMDSMQKIDYLHKRSSELLADMRRLDKENQKNKRRGDNLQKERDNSRTELSKTVSLKEKLEKLCRELQRDNNKMKVCLVQRLPNIWSGAYWHRTRTKNCRLPRNVKTHHGTTSTRVFYRSWRIIKRTRTHRRSKSWICRWIICERCPCTGDLHDANLC